MDKILSIYTEELSSGWEWTPDKYVGGTHEFVVETAKCADFEDVIVYYDGKAGEYDNVLYLPRSRWIPTEVNLCCNSVPDLLGDYNIYWSNLFNARDKDYMQFDERIVLSEFHRKIFGDNSRIVPHSLWNEQFSNPIKKDKKCLYSSSPDRGGEFLKEIWDEVNEKTGADLVMTYSTGISEEEMIDHYKTSQFWLHPQTGIELFCIAAAKAQVAKCIPVVVPNMALETTVKYGVKTTLGNFKEDLINAINNPPDVEDVDFGTWETVTQSLFRNVN